MIEMKFDFGWAGTNGRRLVFLVQPDTNKVFVFCRDDSKNSSSSDSEDDEDYAPSSKELRDELEASEENTDDSEDEVEGGSQAAKRGRTSSRRKKRVKMADRSASPEPQEEEGRAQLPEKSASVNIDDLWNEFKKDVQTAQPKVSAPATSAVAATSDDSDPQKSADNSELSQASQATSSCSDNQPPKTKTITEIFEFAGEAVEVQKEVPVDAPLAAAPAAPAPAARSRSSRGGAGGLSSVLGQISKKNKLSVLEKTQLDWNKFKRDEGIEEDLQTHNRGKEGYLEKQDFLQRADLRQFELEKAMRSKSRRSN